MIEYVEQQTNFEKLLREVRCFGGDLSHAEEQDKADGVVLNS